MSPAPPTCPGCQRRLPDEGPCRTWGCEYRPGPVIDAPPSEEDRTRVHEIAAEAAS